MQGALYRGLFSMNGVLDFQCLSSNCTWPDFSTLALCSTCQDVTASTQIQEEQSCDGTNIISSAYADNDQNFLNCTKYTFTTPGGGTLVGVVALQNATGRYTNGTWMTSVVSTLVVANTFLPGNRTNDDWSLVTAVNIAKFNWSNTWSLNEARQMMATAFNMTECSLSWCLKMYKGVSVVSDSRIQAATASDQ